MATKNEVDALAAAMGQLLDDMGIDGQSVCLAAKAQARIAFEPFKTTDYDEVPMMPLKLAIQVDEETN